MAKDSDKDDLEKFANSDFEDVSKKKKDKKQEADEGPDNLDKMYAGGAQKKPKRKLPNFGIGATASALVRTPFSYASLLVKNQVAQTLSQLNPVTSVFNNMSADLVPIISQFTQLRNKALKKDQPHSALAGAGFGDITPLLVQMIGMRKGLDVINAKLTIQNDILRDQKKITEGEVTVLDRSAANSEKALLQETRAAASLADRSYAGVLKALENIDASLKILTGQNTEEAQNDAELFTVVQEGVSMTSGLDAKIDDDRASLRSMVASAQEDRQQKLDDGQFADGERKIGLMEMTPGPYLRVGEKDDKDKVKKMDTWNWPMLLISGITLLGIIFKDELGKIFDVIGNIFSFITSTPRRIGEGFKSLSEDASQNEAMKGKDNPLEFFKPGKMGLDGLKEGFGGIFSAASQNPANKGKEVKPLDLSFLAPKETGLSRQQKLEAKAAIEYTKTPPPSEKDLKDMMYGWDKQGQTRQQKMEAIGQRMTTNNNKPTIVSAPTNNNTQIISPRGSGGGQSVVIDNSNSLRFKARDAL